MVLGPHFDEYGFRGGSRYLARSKLRIRRLAEKTAAITKDLSRRIGVKKLCETLLQRQRRLQEVPWGELDKMQQRRVWEEINKTFVRELTDRSTSNDMRFQFRKVPCNKTFVKELTDRSTSNGKGFQVRKVSWSPQSSIVSSTRPGDRVVPDFSEDAWQELSGHGDLKTDTKQHNNPRDATRGGGRTLADVVEDFVMAGGKSKAPKPRQKSARRDDFEP